MEKSILLVGLIGLQKVHNRVWWVFHPDTYFTELVCWVLTRQLHISLQSRRSKLLSRKSNHWTHIKTSLSITPLGDKSCILVASLLTNSTRSWSMLPHHTWSNHRPMIPLSNGVSLWWLPLYLPTSIGIS